VVAPDYAGIGLDHDADGNFVAHQFAANPAQGNDMIYSIQAAQKAWPSLSKELVLMGHSQSGGAAWAAVIPAQEPVERNLGTIAASPLTSLPALLALILDNPLLGTVVAKHAAGMSKIFPSFQLSDWLLDEGILLTSVLQELHGCQALPRVSC
jgi:hypothetical protein